MNDNTTVVPAPFESFSDALAEGDTSEKPIKVFVGNNLGYRVNVLQIPMHEFVQMSAVANDPGMDEEQIAQRKLDMPHAQKLAVYILKGLIYGVIDHRVERKQPESPALQQMRDTLGPQPYVALQPLVANIRNCRRAGEGLKVRKMLTTDDRLAAFEVFLSQQHTLWVIDGQHRRKAMAMVFEFLDHVLRTHTYPKKGSLYPADSLEVAPAHLAAWQEVMSVSRSFCKVTIELHLGLDIDQERQLFHDLNNLGKKVDRNLALKFDNSNPVNLFIKNTLNEEMGLKIVEKDSADWRDDRGTLAWKDVVGVNAILFLNKTNIGGAKPTDVTDKTEIAKRLWEAVMAIPGFGEPHAKENTVAAQPVVLKALAKLTYDFAFSNRRPQEAEQFLDTLLSSIADIDFSHQNSMWRYYELSEEQRLDHGLSGLADYLPSTETGNRDIGSYQEGVMRFGAKHNDIHPIIGDMIRWKLGLPSRHK